jgi:hypothetical protein
MSTFSDLTPDNTISGGTNGASIGNVGDRLKTDSLIVIDANSPMLDAFGRQRVSNPYSLFESSFRYDLQADLWSSLQSNGGAIT